MDKKIIIFTSIMLMLLLLVSIGVGAYVYISNSAPKNSDGTSKQLYNYECDVTICEGTWTDTVYIDQYSCDQYEAGLFSMSPLFLGFGSEKGTLRLYDSSEMIGKKGFDTGGWFSLCGDYTVSGKSYDTTIKLNLYDDKDNIIDTEIKNFGG